MIRTKALCLGVIAAALAIGSPAAAAPKSPEKAAADVRARELYKKGDKDYSEGRYEDAFAEFQEAYDLSNRAQLLFNIANAAERLGKYQEAVDALNKYLQSGKAQDKDVVQKRITALQKRIDDKKAEDDAAEKKRQDDAAAAAAAKPPPPPPPPPKPPEKPFPILPVVLMAGGGALLVTSGVFGVLTLGARSDENADCKSAAGGRLCSDKASSAISHDKTFSVVTDVALVSGLVLGGVGAYFLITGGKKSSVDVTTTGRGAMVFGTF